MKKIILALSAISLLSACGQPLTVKDKTYPTYGFLNKDTNKSEKLCYEVSVGNIFWSTILFETIFVPIYFIGFDLFNPVFPKSKDGKCGIDVN